MCGVSGVQWCVVCRESSGVWCVGSPVVCGVVLVALGILQLFLIALLFPVSDGTADGTEEDTVDVSQQGAASHSIPTLDIENGREYVYTHCVDLSRILSAWTHLLASCRASCSTQPTWWTTLDCTLRLLGSSARVR